MIGQETGASKGQRSSVSRSVLSQCHPDGSSKRKATSSKDSSTRPQLVPCLGLSHPAILPWRLP